MTAVEKLSIVQCRRSSGDRPIVVVRIGASLLERAEVATAVVWVGDNGGIRGSWVYTPERFQRRVDLSLGSLELPNIYFNIRAEAAGVHGGCGGRAGGC